ncbi:rhodanese-like domain-containing protein [Streptomyces sp. NPDC047525]|uniref:rhodanese-like domain-containing protein n=1 Tax=Streptomyces sp. NPDC047525 TaxID=3155264 RepID=UPI0034029DB0
MGGRAACGRRARRARRVAGLPFALPDGPLAFICRTGRRGTQAAAQAVGLGRSAVFSLAGGIEAWEAAGLPVVSGPTGK